MSEKPKRKWIHPKDLPAEGKMVPVSARIPDTLHEKLTQLAKKHGHTVGRLVAYAIEVYLEEIGEKPRG